MAWTDRIFARLIPIFIMISVSYIIPHAQRIYLTRGYNGKNFAQTDVSQCEIIYPEKLIGCEDIHVYETPSGPLLFTACAEELQDQLVFGSLKKAKVDLVSRCHC
jgi:hypothetical protein